MTTPHLHTDFVKALKHFAKARRLFEKLVEGELILGNDNHIGDIGEYWVRRYHERLEKFKRYHPHKTGPFDIEPRSGKSVSVKTTTAWSKKGSGSPVKADRGHWGCLPKRVKSSGFLWSAPGGRQGVGGASPLR
jgi:hypothetical protein